MNSRERVLASLRHQEPDVVAVDSGGCSATSISAAAYNRLKAYLGIQGGVTAISDPVQQLAMPEDWYVQRFGVDVVDATRAFCLAAQGWTDWRLSDGSLTKMPPWLPMQEQDGGWIFRDADGQALARLPHGGYFFDQTYWPLSGASEEQFRNPDRYMRKYMWGAMSRPLMDSLSDPSFPALLAKAAKQLYEATDYAILLNAGVSLFEAGQYLCRSDQFMIDLMTDRKKIEALLDRLLELNLQRLEMLLDAAGPYINVIKVNDDFGMQNGPIISPKLFREVFKPRHKAMYDLIHRKQPDVFIFLHCCGSIRALLPDLIDIGLDIVNPVQTSAANMEMRALKRDFGDSITFWGAGADTQSVLPWKTPAEVEADVMERLEVFAPGGGFIFSPIHNISPEVPPENILAMFETVARFRAAQGARS
jgi:uroporphyrinogen decarboxylase